MEQQRSEGAAQWFVFEVWASGPEVAERLVVSVEDNHEGAARNGARLAAIRELIVHPETTAVRITSV